MTNIEIMPVTFELLDNGFPAITFCGEFTVAISNKTFVSSYISYYDNDMKFKLGTLSGNSLSFKWEDEEKKILKVFFKKEFMGYTLVGEIYNVFTKCYQQLVELKKEGETLND